MIWAAFRVVALGAATLAWVLVLYAATLYPDRDVACCAGSLALLTLAVLVRRNV